MRGLHLLQPGSPEFDLTALSEHRNLYLMSAKTAAEALAFVSETRYAVERLFEALNQRRDALTQIGKEIEQLDDTKELLHGIFVDRDQWSHNANYHHIQLVEQTRRLDDERHRLTSESGRRKQLEDLLAKFGATEQAMAILAGSVLQLAKQTLSFRFGFKGNLPDSSAVGTQLMTEVIWEGRNHAMHWEEGRTDTKAHKMLQTLENDGLATVMLCENNSLAILDALGWKTADDVVLLLERLVR